MNDLAFHAVDQAKQRLVEAGFEEIKVNSKQPHVEKTLAYWISRNATHGRRRVSQVVNTTLPAIRRLLWRLQLGKIGWSVKRC